MLKVPRITSLQYLCNISKKTWRMKLIFYQQINIQSILPVDFNTLDMKVSYKVIYHYWWTWSSFVKVLKINKFVISLLYLHTNEYRSLYKLALLFLKEVTRHKTQNRKLLYNIFAKSWQQNVVAAFVSCYDTKHSDILQGPRHNHC